MGWAGHSLRAQAASGFPEARAVCYRLRVPELIRGKAGQCQNIWQNTSRRRTFRLGVAMATDLSDEERLTKAFSVIENTPGMEELINKLRDVLNVDHVVYSLARPPAGLYIHLTYPASWIKRYINMGYADVDPLSREGSQRTLPFSWNELTIQSEAEASFLKDALSHGIGPYGFSIPLLTKHGHRALFSISFSRSEQEWTNFLATTRSALIQIANRVHRRVVVEVFGGDLLI
jgi:hypothetical protein